MIIFGPNLKKEVMGHWYGYVMPDDVPVLLEQHIGKGEIVDHLWRGQMGLSEEDQKKSQELRLQVHGGNNVETSIKASANSCGSQLEGTRCCQLNESSPCCQNPTIQEKESSDFSKGAAKFTAETKNSKKQISRSNSSKGAGVRKVCSMPTWYECWERDDTYAALAVIGTAISVAFAYNCYKQLD